MSTDEIIAQQKQTLSNTSSELAVCFHAIWLSEIALQLSILNGQRTNVMDKYFSQFLPNEPIKGE